MNNTDTPRFSALHAAFLEKEGFSLHDIVEAHELCEELERELTTERTLREAAEREVKTLKEDLRVSNGIGDTFWDALKLLKLEAINVMNPGWHVGQVIHERDELRAQLTAQTALASAREDTAREDTARLDWLLDFITQNGGGGIAALQWTVVDPEELMEDRQEVVFDRAAIDAALALLGKGEA